MKTFVSTDRRRRYDGTLAVVATVAVVATGILGWAPTAAAAGFGEELADAFKNGKFNVNFRYRAEFVDQSDNGKENATASILRTRLVFKTAKWNDLDITINMDDVRPILANDFNDTRNGKTKYQTVADPQGTDLNIAALTYSGVKNTQFVLGRQRVTRGDHRFIGNVGWRQNEQTYDAVSANYKDKKLKASYAYLNRVKRIFGPGVGGVAATWSSNSHVLDAAYTLNDALAVAVYGYLLEFERALGASNQTTGARVSGKQKVGEDLAVTYAAEYATQSDYGDNPTAYDAAYTRAALGLKSKRFGVKAGYELLEGNGMPGQSFQTPLSTLHAMNGWADKFLNTPVGGLQDITVTASAKVSKGSLKVVYHSYSADTGGMDYGTEVDVAAKWPISKNYSLLGKLASYAADSNAPTGGGLDQDTQKAWLMLTAAF